MVSGSEGGTTAKYAGSDRETPHSGRCDRTAIGTSVRRTATMKNWQGPAQPMMNGSKAEMAAKVVRHLTDEAPGLAVDRVIWEQALVDALEGARPPATLTELLALVERHPSATGNFAGLELIAVMRSRSAETPDLPLADL